MGDWEDDAGNGPVRNHDGGGESGGVPMSGDWVPEWTFYSGDEFREMAMRSGFWLSTDAGMVIGDPTKLEVTIRGVRDQFVSSILQEIWESGNESESFYMTGTAPYSLYNGALRVYYQYAAKALLKDFTRPNGTINYLKGSDARLKLKIWVRSMTLSAQRDVLNKLDVIAPSTKATPRFWMTNAGWNFAGKLSVAGGLAGLGVGVVRVVNADDKLDETGKVLSGFAGAWVGMEAVAPLAAGAAAISGPFAPFVSGGILLIGGAAGAIGAEWLYETKDQ